MKTIIFSCSSGAGHSMAAEAIKRELSARDIQADIIDINEFLAPHHRWLLSKWWIYMGQHFIIFYKPLLKYFFSREFQKYVILKSKNYQNKIFQHLNKETIDIIISTYPAGAIMGRYFKEKRPGLLNIQILTDYIYRPFDMIQGTDIFYTPNEYFNKKIEHNLKKVKVKSFGIPIRGEFYKKYSKNKILAKYRLKQNVFTLLIMRGGQGFSTKFTERLVVLLSNIKLPIQLLVLCGTNKKLSSRLRTKTLNSANKTLIFDYTEEVPELMAASDIYIGKPGGIAVSECIAMELPIIAFKSMGGQEDGNVDFIKKFRIGCYCDSHDEILKKLEQLLKDKNYYKSIKGRLKKVKKKYSADKIVDDILLECKKN